MKSALAVFAAVAGVVGGVSGLEDRPHGGSTWARRRRSCMPSSASDGQPHRHEAEQRRRARHTANAVRNAQRLAAHDTRTS